MLKRAAETASFAVLIAVYPESRACDVRDSASAFPNSASLTGDVMFGRVPRTTGDEVTVRTNSILINSELYAGAV